MPTTMNSAITPGRDAAMEPEPPPGPAAARQGMAARVRAHDWSATPLGAADGWPATLRTTVSLVLASPFPGILLWGPGLVVAAYNDAYRPLLGGRPEALGRSFLDVWAEVREELAPQIARAMAGETVSMQGGRFTLLREGRPEEAWFDYGCSPVTDADGRIAGVLNTAVEITRQVRAEQVLQERMGRDLRHSETERERERRLYEAILTNTPDLAYVFDHDHRFTYANEGLLRMWGRSWDEAIGRTCLELGYPDWHAAMHDSEIDHVIATGQPVRGEVPFAGTFGRRIYDYILVPVFDAEGRVEAVAGTTRDVTDSRQAEAALRESEARFRLMADAVPQIIWITDRRGRMEFFNRQFTDYTGAPPRPLEPAEVAAEFMHPEDGPAVVAAFEAALAAGTSFEIEHRIRSAAGEWRWFLARAEPYRDPETGGIVRWFGASIDFHDRRLAEEALQESEARWRGLFERMHEGFALCEMVLDAAGRGVNFRYLEVNAAWERLTGIPVADTLGRLADEVNPEVEPCLMDIFARVVETGEAAHVEHLAQGMGGRWFEMLVYRTEPGRFALLFLNVTERKRAEAHQALLMREVDHRAKNALAVVAAALRLTEAPDVATFRSVALGRVLALARAQTLLSQDRWHGADLRALIEGELTPFVGKGGPRARLEGPPVALPAGAAQPLAMALHELATNAVKYGALSAPAGSIAVTWQLRGGPRGLLQLRWAEQGGPALAGPPARRGFGSRVLDATLRGQLGGRVASHWTTAGLVCEMEAPLGQALDPAAAEGAAAF